MCSENTFGLLFVGESVPEIIARLKRDLIPAFKNGLIYWPLCDFITFKFVPVRLQVWLHAYIFIFCSSVVLQKKKNGPPLFLHIFQTGGFPLYPIKLPCTFLKNCLEENELLDSIFFSMYMRYRFWSLTVVSSYKNIPDVLHCFYFSLVAAFGE